MEKREGAARQKIKVELDEKVAEGIYANFTIITHSPAEFVIDFTRLLPGVPKTKVMARIIMAPMHAKSFMLTLQENIRRFEQENGEIKLPAGNEMPFDINPPADTLPN